MATRRRCRRRARRPTASSSAVDGLPQRPLHLHSLDRVHRAGPPELLGGHVREPDVRDQALGHDVDHRADRVLDRHLRVWEVRIPEIDALDPESGQAGERVLPHVTRLGIHPHLSARERGRHQMGCRVRWKAEPELRRHHGVFAPSVQRSADQELVVGIAPVRVRRVDEPATRIDEMVQRGDAGVIVGRAVHPRRQHHGAVAEGRHLQPAEASRPHRTILL